MQLSGEASFTQIWLTIMAGQLRRAYHSMLYKHISTPLPENSMTHMNTFQLRLEPLSVKKMKPTGDREDSLNAWTTHQIVVLHFYWCLCIYMFFFLLHSVPWTPGITSCKWIALKTCEKCQLLSAGKATGNGNEFALHTRSRKCGLFSPGKAISNWSSLHTGGKWLICSKHWWEMQLTFTRKSLWEMQPIFTTKRWQKLICSKHLWKMWFTFIRKSWQ